MLPRLISEKCLLSCLRGFTVSTGAVVLLLAPALVGGAELYGVVSLPNGTPAAKKSIVLDDRPIGQTDASGVYRLALPPGQHTLAIEGTDVRVTVIVPPTGLRKDLQLK